MIDQTGVVDNLLKNQEIEERITINAMMISTLLAFLEHYNLLTPDDTKDILRMAQKNAETVIKIKKEAGCE